MIFKWFKKKHASSKVKKYIFRVTEINCVGNSYKYTIESISRKEAFHKLIRYFYGNPSIDNDIKMEGFIASRPQSDVFSCIGMPKWFAYLISGHHGNYRNVLKKYASDHNIKLKDE